MRPQRFSCGIRRSRHCIHASLRSFNEAAAFQLRNHHPQDAREVFRYRFNEAAAFQLRNRGIMTRGLERARASMRPQRFSCGIKSSGSAVTARKRCFNEAAAFQLRNQRRKA